MLRQLFNLKKLHKLSFNKDNCSKCIISSSRQLFHRFNTLRCNGNYSNESTTNVQDNGISPFMENKYAFKIITKFPFIRDSLDTSFITNEQDFNRFLAKDWRKESATQIVSAFQNVQNFCIQNKVAIEDERFDNLVDGLMDHAEKLSNNEIVELLECLITLPLGSGYQAHNFHDVWSCLDDICCWKMVEWDLDQQFAIANLWFRLNLGRLCDYTFVLIDRLTRKAENLTKDQLINVLFYFNVCRRRPVDFEYEFALSRCINELTIDELAVVAMGYFKTKTKIKVISILEAMVKKVTKNSKTIHEISLAAILKVVRFSNPYKITNEIDVMLDRLTPEIPRLSELCCLHIALMGTTTQCCHETSLQKVSEKFIKHIGNEEKVRLKEIERILNALSMFNFDPKTEPDFFRASLNELQREERKVELIKYPRCLISLLHYLSLRNIYSYTHINKVLNEEYIIEISGKSPKNTPREIFSLDCSIDIECPDYKGSRLEPHRKYKAAKWMTEFAPSYEQYKKISAADQFFLDTVATVEKIVGNKSNILIDHVLPHFSRADLIICRDTNGGGFIEPPGFTNYILGDVKFALQHPNIEWYAIVVVGWTNTFKESNVPLGNMLMKKRQLAKIGYKPVFVIWTEFLKLSKQAQVDYILKFLN